MIGKELRKIRKKISMISFCGKDGKKDEPYWEAPFGDGRPVGILNALLCQ